MGKKRDPEIVEFEEALLRSIDQAQKGEYGRVHTPEAIQARRRGRPLGSIKDETKVPVKLRLDPDVIAALRATGRGWQTRVNQLLREQFVQDR